MFRATYCLGGRRCCGSVPVLARCGAGEELLGASGMEGTAHVARGFDEELLVVW